MRGHEKEKRRKGKTPPCQGFPWLLERIDIGHVYFAVCILAPRLLQKGLSVDATKSLFQTALRTNARAYTHTHMHTHRREACQHTRSRAVTNNTGPFWSFLPLPSPACRTSGENANASTRASLCAWRTHTILSHMHTYVHTLRLGLQRLTRGHRQGCVHQETHSCICTLPIYSHLQVTVLPRNMESEK